MPIPGLLAALLAGAITTNAGAMSNPPRTPDTRHDRPCPGAAPPKMASCSRLQALPQPEEETAYDSATETTQRRASGYKRDGVALQNADFDDMSVPFSAGALHSTTHDLLTWEGALFGGKLLSPSSLQKMTTPFKDGYGLGLRIESAGQHRSIWHGGDIDGFSDMIVTYPDDHLTIIVLDNIATPASRAIANDLAKIAFGKDSGAHR